MAENATEKLDLINKIVKTRDPENGIDNSGIISFMYPNFIKKDEIFFDYENSVIIECKYSSKLKEELSHGTKQFIALCDNGIPDIDFTNREVIMQVLKDKRKSKFGKDKEKLMMEMPDIDFWNLYKRLWVLHMGVEKSDTEEGIYNLYETLGGQTNEIFEMYFKILDKYGDRVIYSSLLSFIDKSLNPEKVSSENGNYLKLLRKFREGLGERAKLAVEESYKMKCSTEDEKQYRTMLLLRRLGKGSPI